MIFHSYVSLLEGKFIKITLAIVQSNICMMTIPEEWTRPLEGNNKKRSHVTAIFTNFNWITLYMQLSSPVVYG